MKINNYIDYIVTKGLNVQKFDIVEIITSVYLKKYNKLLEEACLKKGASLIFIKYTDGKCLEDTISLNCNLYIKNEVERYKKLINKKFVRIKINSPFLPKMVLDDKIIKIYKDKISSLRFVEEYFSNLKGRFTICSFPNPYWAQKLKISEDELLDKIINLSFIENNYLEEINKLKLKKLIFIDDFSNIEFELTNNFLFQGKKQVCDNILFEPNIPCLEIYTAPNKMSINGYILANRTMNYNGNLIDNIYLKFHDGLVIDSNVDNIIKKNGMNRCGEIALSEYVDFCYLNTILDENCSPHLALGKAYKYGITEINKINNCNYHFDICFGTKKMLVYGENFNKKYLIMKNGKFIIEEI